MIACPICGKPTAVIETRASAGGARRRRKCADPACAGRVTTIEVVVDQWQRAGDLADGTAVIVSRQTIARLQHAVAALGGES